MLFSKTMALAFTAIASVYAAPTALIELQSSQIAKRQALAISQTGTNGGYYYSFRARQSHRPMTLKTL